ncbi:MAG: PAS domain S-box protein, partial [Cytophagales bacterium]|nr:PAS domain S-box protein [Cytophaga sp.]
MDLNQEELYKELFRLKEENTSLKHSIQTNPYKLLFESSPDIIIQVDVHYNIMLLHVPDYPIEKANALIGTNLFSRTPLHIQDAMRNALSAVFSTGEIATFESELEVSGSYRYFSNHLSAIRNEKGEIDSVYFVSRDITTQKISDKFNIESKRKLQALFENSHHILTLLDIDGKIIWFNKKADEHHSRFGKPMKVGALAEDYFEGERLITFRENIQKILKGDVITYIRQFVWEDNIRYLEICLQPVYEGQTMIAISLSSTDITESKEYEEKLKKINSELVQQNDQLNQYSYIISHNLRAPIVTLLGLVTIFNLTKNDEEEKQTIISHIYKSAYHLDTVIKDLNIVLSVSDKKALMSSIHLDEEFDIVQFLLKDQIVESHAIIEFDFVKYPVIVSVKSYIHNILYNLLS